MKLGKILLLALSLTLLMGAFSSCVTDATEIAVQLSFVAGDDRVFSSEVKVNAENPSVIDVVREAMAYYELDIQLDTNETTVERVSRYRSDLIDEVQYYWEYTINDKAPSAGRASDNTVVAGDVIKYVFMTSRIADDNQNELRPKTTVEPYKSESGVFEDNDSEETEEETEEAEAE